MGHAAVARTTIAMTACYNTTQNGRAEKGERNCGTAADRHYRRSADDDRGGGGGGGDVQQFPGDCGD